LLRKASEAKLRKLEKRAKRSFASRAIFCVTEIQGISVKARNPKELFNCGAITNPKKSLRIFWILRNPWVSRKQEIPTEFLSSPETTEGGFLVSQGMERSEMTDEVTDV